jgi:hypothetical protein
MLDAVETDKHGTPGNCFGGLAQMSHQSGFQPGIVFENKACLATADYGLPGCPVSKEAADLSLGKAISEFSQPPRVIISRYLLRRYLDKNSRR